MIALAKNASGQFVGDIVCWMSYGWNNYSFVTFSITGNQHMATVSTLGYPFLIMQRSDGPTYTTTLGGAGQLWQGSNFTGGSSATPDGRAPEARPLLRPLRANPAREPAFSAAMRSASCRFDH